MVRFSLYKRRRTKGVYYYVRFWNPEKKSYDPGLSIETLRSKLGDDSFRRIGTRSAAAAIAVRVYEEGLTKKERKSHAFVEYVLNFWDSDSRKLYQQLLLFGSCCYRNHGGEEERKEHRFPFSKTFLQFDASR